MSNNIPYVDQDTIDSIRNAWAFGNMLSALAPQVGLTEDQLRQLLGLPEVRKPESAAERDLWAADELDNVL